VKIKVVYDDFVVCGSSNSLPRKGDNSFCMVTDAGVRVLISLRNPKLVRIEVVKGEKEK